MKCYKSEYIIRVSASLNGSSSSSALPGYNCPSRSLFGCTSLSKRLRSPQASNNCTITSGLSCSSSRADVKDLPRYNIKVQWSFIHISNNFKPVNFSHALYLVIKSFNPFLMGSRQFLGHGCACSEYKRVLVCEFVSPNTMFIGLGTTLSAQRK